jgi:hypothetical protein
MTLVSGRELLGHALSMSEGWVRIRAADGTLWLNMDAIATWELL